LPHNLFHLVLLPQPYMEKFPSRRNCYPRPISLYSASRYVISMCVWCFEYPSFSSILSKFSLLPHHLCCSLPLNRRENPSSRRIQKGLADVKALERELAPRSFNRSPSLSERFGLMVLDQKSSTARWFRQTLHTLHDSRLGPNSITKRLVMKANTSNTMGKALQVISCRRLRRCTQWT